jgi:formylmethanofuran dehydrogenase subunit B
MAVFKDIVCPFCGCLCDDIEVTVEGNEIVGTRNACAISRSKFMNHSANKIDSPTVDGKAVALMEAVDAAAEVLALANRPLVYGLSSTECEAIGRAVELAELTGGVVDNTSSVCHGPTILALQQVGESKTTLGEVKNRADLIIFWGSNPTEAHLRHIIRYSVMPKGLYTPEGRKSRYVVAVDIRETRMARVADQFLKIEPGKDFELLLALRAVVRGAKLQAEEVAGVPREEIDGLARRMKGAKMGIIFFGLGLTQSDGKHMNVDVAVGLVAELNHHTKFLLTPMRGHYNVAGANTVTTWQTGYPYAVDFARGYPRYNPGEYTAVDLLAKDEADAAIIVASDPGATFPADAVRNMARIPVVTLDQKVTPTTMLSKIVIPVATVGVEAEGTAYRMDGVPLRMKKVVEPHEGVLPDAKVLKMIVDRVRTLKEVD